MGKMTEKNVIAAIILAIILSVSGFLGYIYFADVAAMSSIEVTINDVDITDVKFTSFTFKLKLDANIYNPTDQDISGLSSTFDIYIEDNYIGEGGFSNVFIPAHAQSEKDVSITISGLAVAAVDVIKNVITEGKFDLNISGNINGNVLFGLITFSQEFETTHTYS